MKKLSPVSLRIGERIQCSQCFRMSAPIYADLQGEAFKSYYCPECAKPHMIVSHDRRGSGGEIVITAPSREAVIDEAKRIKAGMDFMRSPSITEHGTELQDGRFRARVTHYTLD